MEGREDETLSYLDIDDEEVHDVIDDEFDVDSIDTTDLSDAVDLNEDLISEMFGVDDDDDLLDSDDDI